MLNLLTFLLSPPATLPPTAPAPATPINLAAQEPPSPVPTPAAPEYLDTIALPPPANSPERAVSPSLSLAPQYRVPQWSAQEPPSPVPTPAAPEYLDTIALPPPANSPERAVSPSLSLAPQYRVPQWSSPAPLAAQAVEAIGAAAQRGDDNAAGLPANVTPEAATSALQSSALTLVEPAQKVEVNPMTKQVATQRDRQAVIESKRAQIVASPLTNDLAARRRDRQAVIETRLAAIVARDRGAKNLQMPAPPIAAAIDSANQGQFEQARQIVQTSSISAVVRRNVLQQIATLEATTIKPTAIRDPMQARQIVALSKVQRSRGYRVKAAAGSAGRSEPSPAARSANLSVINSANSPRLAYNRLLAPNTLNNGDMQIVYPVPVAAPITSPFGWRVHPISRARRFHSGTDIGAAQGTPVLAAYSGRVKGADYMGGYGLAITIEHKNGTLDTLYAHLSQATVRPGDWVEQGAMIGEVGSTGASTGPHLHFEIRKLATDGWATLDPGPQLQQARNQLIKVTNQAHRDQPTNQG